jgi:hypothetical protein
MRMERAATGKSKGKGQYGDSGCARMTARGGNDDFRGLRRIRRAGTGNNEEQATATTKCGGPSTAAAKYAASGRDDGFIFFPVGMTGYRLRCGMTNKIDRQRQRIESCAHVASF